ncbi:MAG: ATP-binding protein [Anaerolineae bacterium]
MTADEQAARDKLLAAIAAQEQLRGSLGDAIVDTTIAALRAQLDQIQDADRSGTRRRLATVVFVDVVGSTRLLRDLDPEEAMAVMDSALQRLAGPVLSHGGRVTRFMGDGYLAVFGLPRSRENDPEMAVRAALAIQAEAAVIGTELEHLGSFALRIGINTGLVVSGGATEAEDTIMGAEVNLAARLESAAPPGGILISHGTLQHVRDLCVVEHEGEIEAKGFAAPVAVYRVLEMREAARHGARPIVPGIETPLIGRESDLAVLGDGLAGARAQEALRVVGVAGEPGIGKSRLVSEFVASLPDSVRHLTARVSSVDREVPYALIRELLSRRFDLRIGDTVDDLRQKLTDGLGAELGERAPEGANLIGRLVGFDLGGATGDPQSLRDRALSLLAEFLRPKMQGEATVLVVEDLQWADQASLDALGDLLDRLRETPTLVIAVGRLDFWADASSPSLAGHRIDLGPLDEAAASELVDAVLETVDGETFSLRRLLLAGAEGNPYFLEEIVRMLVDDGVLTRSDSRWMVEVASLSELRVPPTLTGVIQARLDALPERERLALRCASVVGRVFWDDAVESLSAIVAVPETLASLVRRDMVLDRDTSMFANTCEYAFRHNPVREVAYEGVLLDDRRKLHGLAADWLLGRSRERSGELSGVIATHLLKAGRDDEALEYLARAADAARTAYAIAAADDFYEKALAIVSEDDDDLRYDLLCGRQEVLGLQGDRAGQRHTLDELDEVAERLGDPDKQAGAAVERTWLAFYSSDYDAAFAAASRAADLTTESGNRALQSRARSALAWACFSLGETDLARQHAEAALTLAIDAGHREYEAAARNTLGMLSLAEGNPSESSSHLVRALELANEMQDPGAETSYRNNLAVARTLLGDYDGAQQLFAGICELAEAAGDVRGASSAYINLAWVADNRRDWDTAAEMARQGLRMTRLQGHREAEAEALLWLGHALTGLGRADEALEAYGRSLAIRDELGQTALALGVRAGMARAHLGAGDTDGAMGQIERILAYLDGGGSLSGTWEPLWIHLTCVEVLDAVGDARRERVLERAAAELSALAARITDPSDRQILLEAVPWHRRIMELAEAGATIL